MLSKFNKIGKIRIGRGFLHSNFDAVQLIFKDGAIPVKVELDYSTDEFIMTLLWDRFDELEDRNILPEYQAIYYSDSDTPTYIKEVRRKLRMLSQLK